MTEKTGTEIMMRSEYAMTRGRAAAMSAGFRTEAEIQAFIAGAEWFWKAQKKLVVFTPGPITNMDSSAK